MQFFFLQPNLPVSQHVNLSYQSILVPKLYHNNQSISYSTVVTDMGYASNNNIIHDFLAVSVAWQLMSGLGLGLNHQPVD